MIFTLSQAQLIGDILIIICIVSALVISFKLK